MSEDEAERFTREFLEAHGFVVERIPRAEDRKRADYRVTDPDATYHGTYLLEVKYRIDGEQYLSELERRGTAIRADALGRTNAASKRIRESAEQLTATAEAPEAFRIVTFVVGGHDPETQVMQFQSTLYGTVDLLISDETGAAFATPCFYFSFNEFYNLRELDGALIITAMGARVCLNNFSRRAASFRQSRLFVLLNSAGAACDPAMMESRGEAFLVDCDLDRRDEAALLRYIEQKYRCNPLMTFKTNKVAAAVIVRR